MFRIHITQVWLFIVCVNLPFLSQQCVNFCFVRALKDPITNRYFGFLYSNPNFPASNPTLGKFLHRITKNSGYAVGSLYAPNPLHIAFARWNPMYRPENIPKWSLLVLGTFRHATSDFYLKICIQTMSTTHSSRGSSHFPPLE